MAVFLKLVACLLVALPSPAQDRPAKSPAETPTSFGVAFAEHVRRSDTAWLRERVDREAILDRALEPLDLEGKLARSGEQFREGALKTFHLMRQVSQSAKGGSYEFRGVREIEGERRLLFRLLTADGGLNFHEIRVEERDGIHVVVDLYPYATGEFLSTTFRRVFVQTTNSPNLLARFLGKSNEFAGGTSTMLKMANAVQARRYEEARDLYRELPKALRREKMVLVLYVQAASMLGEKAYAEALADFERHIPENDPSRNLMLLDAYFMRENADAMRKTLDRLLARTGPDGWLRCLQVLACDIDADLDRAQSYADRAVREEPTLEDAHLHRISVALRRGAHEHVVVALDEASKACEISLGWLRELEGFEAFADSKPGRRWLAGKG